MKLTQQDMARLLEVDARTLRNWKNNKLFLYKTLMQGFAVQDAIKQSEDNLEKLKEIAKKDK